MPKFWNTHHMHVQPAGGDGPAVAPGESYEFTDEEAEHLGVGWTDQDPRRGLQAEREWKAKRDAKVTTEPAESGKTEEEKPE